MRWFAIFKLRHFPQKMKRSNWNVSYCSYKEIYSSVLISRHMTGTKILNKMLLLKQWLKHLENEVVLGSIFLVKNEVPVPPSFVSMVIPAPSMPASAYKAHSKSQNPWKDWKGSCRHINLKLFSKINCEYFCWISLNWTIWKIHK